MIFKSIILKQSGRNIALSRLVTLSVYSLRNLDIEANNFYDRAHRLYDAALLTRCSTQHALRPYIDSEINHIRHFIKVRKTAKIRKRYNQVPHLTQDTTWESNKIQ